MPPRSPGQQVEGQLVTAMAMKRSPDKPLRRAIAHTGMHGDFMNITQVKLNKSVSRRFAVSTALALALAAVPATAASAAASAPHAAAKSTVAQSTPIDGHDHGHHGKCILVVLICN
jgi:hypothetical protein